MDTIYLSGTTDYCIHPFTCELYRYIPGLHWVKVEPDYREEYPYWLVEYPSGWRKVYCHRVIAEQMLGYPGPGMVVNHKDTNKHNFHVNNLEWITQSENIIHAHQHNLTNATPLEIVKLIKKLLLSGMTTKQIAEVTNTNYQTVFDIKTGRRHAHVTI